MNQKKKRCEWSLKDEHYIKYHDEKWGIPVHNDKVHFEYLALEAAQAGLSWYTILIRMKGYTTAFADWDIDKIEKYDEAKIQELLQFKGIIRNRRKIEAVIHNVKPFKAIQAETLSAGSKSTRSGSVSTSESNQCDCNDRCEYRY